MKDTPTEHSETSLFRQKNLVLIVFLLASFFLLLQATQIKLDSSFTKNIPLNHDYMKAYSKHEKSFGGANNIFISVCNKEGDIFTTGFFDTFKKVHDKLLSIPSIDSLKVKSLYSSSVRFIEATEGHFSSGTVIPENFQKNASGLESVRHNIDKANLVGSIISNDYSCSMLNATFTKFNNNEKNFNSLTLATALKYEIKQVFENDNTSIHIIGFDTMAGDLADGLKSATTFFTISIAVTAVMLYFLHHSVRLSLLPVLCSLCAVIFEMGILSILGFRLDPMSILAPFLVFMIGLIHSVQMINSVVGHINRGLTCHAAAQVSFKQLLTPAVTALLINTVVFFTLYSIDIDIIQEFAITASLGVAMVVLTNLLLLPLLLSCLTISPKKVKRTNIKTRKKNSFWHFMASFATKGRAAITLVLMVVLLLIAWLNSNNLKIGDTHSSALALGKYSSYNQDFNRITNHYEQSHNYLSVMVETTPDACTYYDTMNIIEKFQWRMDNIEGVQSTLSLADKVKRINEIYNEGNPKWRVLPRNHQSLVEYTSHILPSMSLSNSDCSVMPVNIYLRDHKADTIKRVINEVNEVAAELGTKQLKFILASGPITVLAATNETIAQAVLPILLSIYGSVIVMCLLIFRNLKSTIAITLPLIVISNLTLWLLTALDIGLTVFTFPLITLSIGISVNQGIYILSAMNEQLKLGSTVQEAYYIALKQRGNAVLLTGVTLAIAISTWHLSDFAFQEYIAGMLTFILLSNVVVSLIFLPALSAFLWSIKRST